MSNRPWRILEQQTLVAMWKVGAPASAIGAKLGRSERGIFTYVQTHRQRVGLTLRHTKWTTPERRLIEREMEMLFQRLKAGLPHRTRVAVSEKMISYLLHERTRREKRERIERIADLGGMADIAHPKMVFGHLRKARKRKAA